MISLSDDTLGRKKAGSKKLWEEDGGDKVSGGKRTEKLVFEQNLQR